jgi:hypothetical protein
MTTTPYRKMWTEMGETAAAKSELKNVAAMEMDQNVN